MVTVMFFREQEVPRFKNCPKSVTSRPISSPSDNIKRCVAHQEVVSAVP